jgi:hypothetical protein
LPLKRFGMEAEVGIGRFHARFGANMAQVLSLHQHNLISHSHYPASQGVRQNSSN